MATSPDRFVAIQGFAGVGKTFMQKEGKTLIEQHGLVVKGFAPTGSAVATMQEDTGIPSRTIDSFLFELEQQQRSGQLPDCSKEVWIMDEASLVAANNMASMMTFARRTGARLVMQGDKKQIGAIEWGKPFTLMQQSGINTARMDDIIRQENSALKASVYHAIDGQIHQAIKAVPDMFVEVTGKDKEEGRANRIEAAAQAYVELSPSERGNSLMVIPDNETRMAVMEAVRGKLIQRGELAATGTEMTALVSADMTPVQKRDVRFYEHNMVLEFNRAYKKDIAASRGERLEVVAIDPMKNLLTLRDEKGRQQQWNPRGVAKRGIDVFKKENIEIAPKDKVIWKRTDKSKGMINGDKGEVVNVDPERRRATVRFERGGERVLDLDKDRHLMWNYATTAYSSQGMTVSHVIGIVESFRRNVVNQKSFYVTLSRAKQAVTLFTDSKRTLANEVQKRLADKTSSLEAVKALANRQQRPQQSEPAHDPTLSPYMQQRQQEQRQQQQEQRQQEQRQHTLNTQRVR
jgi:ATP-dependent exoDNAse (exonuclease V) alpha subunit